MPVGIMRYEVARTAKEMRECQGYTTADVAKNLEISEKEYIDFEECKSPPEDDYYIVTGLALMYGVTCENFFRSVKGEHAVEDILGKVRGITPEFQEKFISIIERLGYIGKEEFEWLEREKGGFKFAYIDYDGILQYAALCKSDGNYGDYLVILKNDVHISKLGIYDNEKCFKIKDRMYPIDSGCVTVFGKIYSGIE